LFAASASTSSSNATKKGGNVMENKPEVWLTTADQNFLLTKVNLETYIYKDLPARRINVEIDPTKKFQQMVGWCLSNRFFGALDIQCAHKIAERRNL